MKRKSKVYTSLLIALILLCSMILPSLAASYQNGSTGKVTVSGVWAFHGGRKPGETSSTSNGGNRGNHYNNRLYWYEGYSIDILQMDGSQYTPQYNGKTYIYCVHKWIDYGTGNRKFYVDPNGKGNLTQSPYWNSLSAEKRKMLMLTTIYGFPARTPQQLGVSTVDDAYAATQAIIWEIVTGRRNSGGWVSGYRSTAEEKAGGVPASVDNVRYFYDKYMHYGYTGNGHKAGEATPALTAYNKIVADMAMHDTLSSFNGQTLTLRWDAATKTYKGSVTDSNGMLANSSVTSSLPSGLTASISGNTITFTATRTFGTTGVTLNKNLPKLYQVSPLAVLEVTRGKGQEMLCGVMNDPRAFSMSIRTAQGTAKIVKTSEDGIVSGLKFRVTGNGIDKTYTTNSAGQITDTLPAGTYTVTEVNTPGRYNTPASRALTVPDGGTGTVNFSNTIKKGYVELYKTDTTTGKALAGAVFGIYNSANTRIGGLTTNASGYAKSGLLPYGDGYYLIEEKAPEGYVVDTTKRYFNMRTNGQTITIRTANKSQMGQIAVQKNDGETGKPVTASPATFEIRAAADIKTPDGTVRLTAGQLADTITTKGGIGSSKQLFLGDYVITEKTAPDGYAADGKQYPVTLAYGGQTIQIVTESVTVPNMPQMGKITIHKTDAETGKPVTGAAAVFTVHAKTDIVTGDGTIRYKAGELVDTITTADGSATSKPLYLGSYIVTEETAPEGYILDPEPQEVTLSYGGQSVQIVTESLTFENTPQKGKIIIQKNDAESGKPITASSAVFELRAKTDIITADGTIRHKAGELIETLTTEDGAVTSGPLYLGTYTVTEKTAPEGYVQDTAVYDVTLFYGEQTIKVVTEGITIGNAPQMGSITITKRDKETGQPIILSDATFEIHAKTDIITGDGVTHYRAGELVDTLTTVQGVTASKHLYLGTYTVTEITAPDGYILDSTPHDVTLTYGGQSVELVTESLTLDNAPQMGQITITKVDKETGKPIVGADAVFELRAKADIVTADGTIRHKADELIDTLTTQNGVVTTGRLYLGVYTITEITAPTGYILDDTPHDVTLFYGGQDVELVTESLVLENAPQMGQIVIIKVDGETGKPIILSSATFEIRAAEDIITPDGTIRYTKGQLVDTLVTKDGRAVSKLLYLGQYVVIETIAPEGYILDTAPYVAALLYDGQVAMVQRMAAGPEVGQMGNLGAVEDTRNNNTLTIPNNRVPETPKTGVSLPIAALAVAGGAGIACILFRRKKRGYGTV